jgi:argininosuccinate lyase
MADFLWQKPDSDVDDRVMRFMAGADVELDRHLFLYDVRASQVHVEGLARIGSLGADEAKAICASLAELAQAFERGDFVLDQRFEDGHSAIEAWLTEQLGDAGKKVHTGRSRNDQVLVASRLLLRESLVSLAGLCEKTASECLSQARTAGDMPMPGYTHLQRAVVSSVATWFAAFAESFIDNGELALATRDWINANPLGTAAGFGVNLPLARDYSTIALGFSRTQLNPIYAQNSRGKFELQALTALAQALLDVRRYAWDLSLFTTAEFDFVSLPDAFTTGSSIMPNKRNPDLVELLRASYPGVQGAMTELQSLLSLPSGYHRDLQNTKGPLVRALVHGLDAMALMPDLVRGTQFRPDRLLDALEPSMYATDRAIEMTASGVPFREAYRRVREEYESLADRKPAESIGARVSPGAPGNLRLDLLEDRLDTLRMANQNAEQT